MFLEAALEPETSVALDRTQANYLLNVLRLGEGATVLVFNGRDGEWRARLAADGRRSA
ncbi:MAG: 16S rRNA (uracil(1498)-N(3))-methyltransferase, partial [Methylobacteriaceae bacterium]|nr:16S rRNA (uracil(1498)-N(3))-methyltransferase [Methylobacteriaceae bacterium]